MIKPLMNYAVMESNEATLSSLSIHFINFSFQWCLCFMFTKSCRGAYVGRTMGNKGDEGRMEDVYGKGL
jgi:hypothetical protein